MTLTRDATSTTFSRSQQTAAAILWLALAAGIAVLMTSVALPSALALTRANAAQLPLYRFFLERFGFSLDLLIAAQLGLDLLALGVYVVAATIIFIRNGRELVALLLSGMLLSAGFTFGSFYATVDLSVVAPLLVALYDFLEAAALILLVAALNLFPDGRFVWRPARPMAWGFIALVTAFQIVSRQQAALPPTLGGAALVVLSVLLLPFVISGVYVQVRRYVSISNPIERQQTKWVVLGLAAWLLAQAARSALLGTLAARSGTLAAIGFLAIFSAAFLMAAALPVTIAVAALRYRLWDIDFLINRGLVYTGLAVLLGTVFATSVFLLDAFIRRVAGGPLPSVTLALSGLVVALIFQPARSAIRRTIDRRFYGIELDYKHAIHAPPGQTPTMRVWTPDSRHTQLGEYRELLLVGRGGMAPVYSARHPTHGERVAIKVLPNRLAALPDFRERFQREAQMVAGLEHPNIVRLRDFGSADETYFMVMDFLDGQDLDEYVSATGPLPLQLALSVTRDVAAALDYAHQRGVVHRDVKPGNIMLASDPLRAVLTDFGIARMMEDETLLSLSGLVGTLEYIAPEQIRHAAGVDGRADVYSLGVVLYEMVTGRLPFSNRNPGALLIAQLQQPPPDPREVVPDLPPNVAEAVMKAMAKLPAERFQSAGELATALD